MLKTFVLLGCFWRSSGGFPVFDMVLVQTGLLRSLSISSIRFLFLVNSFLTDFFTSYAGNHQGVQKVAFHQQYAPQQIGLDQWQQLQDTSWSH